MAWFKRKKKAQSNPGTLDRAAGKEDLAHLAGFISARTGVEAYLEPKTTVTETTVMLIAHDGEWTRRRVAGRQGAFALAEKYDIPLYEAEKTGYPQRKRDFDARRKAARRKG
ncbi:oxidoreductase [Salininema proteolyticum]|uniref:Oxidoreductase n=1 Tax=Salininema proteolyticum TaxID=1607685 RepID=A0ABV8U209_9ACTN